MPPTPSLLGLGGSLRLGLPVTSFALLPFLASLVGMRFLAQRARTPILPAMVAAVAYALIVAVVAALAGSSTESGNVTVNFAPGPFSTAIRGLLWVGLGALLGVALSRGPLLPARVRQVLRGALWAVGVSLAVVLVLTVIIAIAQQAFGASAPAGPTVPEGVPRPEFSGGSARGALSALGTLFALLPMGLAYLWLLANGIPIGFQNVPDLGQIPLVGQTLADMPLLVALLGHWPWGWAWRLLVLGPIVGLIIGGMVAACGAPPQGRWRQGALVSLPYAAIALLTTVLVGITAEATLGGAAKVEVAFRASLVWLLLLVPVGGILGAVGGLLTRLEAFPAPHPYRAFLATSKAAGVVLLGSLPALAFSSGGNQPAAPLASEGRPFSSPPASPEPTEPPATPAPGEEASPSNTPEEASSEADPAFDPLLPTLRQKTSAPIMLPAELPDELENATVDADRGGEEYGILFLFEPSGNVEQSYVHANDAGTIVAAPEPPYESSGVFEATKEEQVELPDGTKATLEFMEPKEGELVNQGPYWEGSFERDDHNYVMRVPLQDPSGDMARQVLSSMVEVQDEETSNKTAERGAGADGPAPGYNLVETPDGGLSAEVPPSWGVETGEDSEKEGDGPGSWSYHVGSYLFSSITTARSLEVWYSGEQDSSGAYFVAARELAEYSDYELTHSLFNANKSEVCVDEGSYEDYNRPPLSGKLQTWYGCGPDGATVYTLAAYPEGRECVLALNARVSDEAEREAIEHLVNSVEVDCGRVTSGPLSASASPSPSASPEASAPGSEPASAEAQNGACSDPAYKAQNPGECGTVGYNPVSDPGDNYHQGVVVGDDTPDCARPEDVLESGLCAQ